jgi:hypothetical protein
MLSLQLTCGFYDRWHSVFHGEADFDGHLPVMHISLGDIAARLMALATASSMEVVEVPVSSMSL